MPEGDTVHKLARVLGEALTGVSLQTLTGRGQQVMAPAGTKVTQISALGKHCLISLSTGFSLRIHLGMHGLWQRTSLEKAIQGEVHLVLETPSERFLLLQARDVELFPTAERNRHPILRQLGPDLLGPEPDWEAIARRARSCPQRPLGEVLLDQRLAAGLGNVYRNELCFLGAGPGALWKPAQGIHPRTPVEALSLQELEQLYQRGRRLMLANLGGWPRTTTGDGRSSLWAPTRPRSWVYGRHHQPCLVCRTPIRVRGADAAGDSRMLCWCPTCQPLDRSGKPSSKRIFF